MEKPKELEKIRNETEQERNLEIEKIKTANAMAIWSFILSIATYPLTMTIILWLPSLIISIFLGIIALVDKTNKKGFAIAGLALNGMFILICVLSVVLAFMLE